ncbi:MAG: AMIN domain-containing protein [Desulfobulbaceae bacterium]|nr:AMIN domain-containing protein [Desulfobulbaceae bacterium]
MATLTRQPIKVLWASWLITVMMVSASMAAVSASDPTRSSKEHALAYRIRSVNWEQSEEEYILRIKGGSTPTYTIYELFEPLRVIIDIADASLDPSVSLPIELPQSPVSLVNGKIIADKKPSFARIELFLREDHTYTVDRADNDILVKFPKSLTKNVEPAVSPSQSASTPKLTTLSQPETTIETVINRQEVAAPVLENAGSTFATRLMNIEISKNPSETKIYLKTDGSIRNFKKVLLGKNPAANRPDRMYLDLNNIRLIGAAETISVGTSISKVRTSKRQDGLRVVFDSGLDKMFDYSINKQPDGLLITTKEPSSANEIISNLITANKEAVPAVVPIKEGEKSSITAAENTLITEPIKPTLSTSTVLDETTIDKIDDQGLKKSFKAPGPADVTFAGYNKQRITVDFYKIDLHNVFRLFGEISNLNIVVDEAVNGSLSLALNDVPWDFALDIILNLKDLQKEERFNTIVISPKSKSFTWPARALDNVEFKSEIQVKQAEKVRGGIKIGKLIEVPENEIEAKKLIQLASINERKGDFATALPLYEDAFTKWNDNINLAKRIANMCLVNLEQNAKALHYARTVLKLSPGDNDAALLAAIGLARMKRNTEAKEYFEISVSGAKPPKEALASYSSYCEEQLDYDCALIQLKRHEELHGDTLETMVSKARVYDKQGKQDLAAQEYRSILLSGYTLPPDLAHYVKGRAVLAGR